MKQWATFKGITFKEPSLFMATLIQLEKRGIAFRYSYLVTIITIAQFYLKERALKQVLIH